VLETAKPIHLSSATLEAFSSYIRQAENDMGASVAGDSPLLLVDARPEGAKQALQGKIVAQAWSASDPAKIADGLIHDWIGTAYCEGNTVDEAVSLVQDYDHHKDVYKPQVMDSKLITRSENNFLIYLRLLKKKVITVVLDTYHDVHYSKVSATRWRCRSYTTRICEVEHAGGKGEFVLLPDTGYGFLWRLYSYWRFEERDAGVWIECRAISLTRDIPKGLGWIVEPIIHKLPRESLIDALQCTKQALVGKFRQPSK
jgi:hypothetical protein